MGQLMRLQCGVRFRVRLFELLSIDGEAATHTRRGQQRGGVAELVLMA
jgi:hypothetical protein